MKIDQDGNHSPWRKSALEHFYPTRSVIYGTEYDSIHPVLYVAIQENQCSINGRENGVVFVLFVISNPHDLP